MILTSYVCLGDVSSARDNLTLWYSQELFTPENKKDNDEIGGLDHETMYRRK
jgi:hypothetical protein